MSNQITLRKYKIEDTQELANIIRETWYYDELTTPKIAKKLSKAFLYSCLADQTFTQIAEIDGAPVGIIMGKNIKKYRCPIQYRIKLFFSILSLYITKEGRQVSKIFQQVNRIDQELLRKCNKNYQGEISFFAVNPKYRGLGIGKTLFNNLLSYMKNENIQDFYLFTDTSCNYGFYERQGMKRRNEQATSLALNDITKDIHFFIYDYQFD